MARFNVTSVTQDRIVHEERQEKRVPYSVHVIGGEKELAAWKAEQRKKEEEWKSKEHERLAKHTQAIIDGTYLRRLDDENTRADRHWGRWPQLNAPAVKLHSNFNEKKPKIIEPKQTLKSRLLTWAINKFLDLIITKEYK